MKVSEIHLFGFDVINDISIYEKYVFIVGWNHNSSRQENYACLAGLDWNGKMVWNTTWADERGSRGLEVSCNKDSLYVIYELRNILSTEYYLIKFSFDGKQEWNRTWTSIVGVYATTDGVYIIKEGELTKLDEQGNILWEVPVDGSTIEVTNNRVYVAGSTSKNSSKIYDAFVAAFDYDGRQLWNASRTSDIGDTAGDICIGVDGIYIVGTGTKGWDFRFITKFDFDGRQVWDKQWRKIENRTFVSLTNFQGKVYAVGAEGYDSSQFNALIAQIDSNGIISWSYQFGDQEREDYAYSISTSDERVYVVGISESYLLPPLRWHGFLLIFEPEI